MTSGNGRATPGPRSHEPPRRDTGCRDLGIDNGTTICHNEGSYHARPELNMASSPAGRVVVALNDIGGAFALLGGIAVKEIPLTKGYMALVDDEDYEELSRRKWCVVEMNGAPKAMHCLPRDEQGKRRCI